MYIGFGSASSKQEILKPANENEESNSGFVRSDEFKTFSAPDNFSPSYFQKAASSESSNLATKPKYVEDDDGSEVHDLNRKPNNKNSYKDRSNNPKPKAPTKGKHSSSYKANRYSHNPGTAKTSSYHASPSYSPQYNAKFTQTPYQKYSFQAVQPVAHASASPYDPAYSRIAGAGHHAASSPYDYYQPSEIVSHKIQAKDCTRIEKKLPKEAAVVQGARRRTRREAMQCYICRDAASGANYEQCSYNSQEDPSRKSYASGSLETYSSANGNGFRYKRYSQSGTKEPLVDAVDQDPYEYVKSYNGEAYKDAANKDEGDEDKDADGDGDGEKDYYRSEGYGDSGDDYRFGPEYFADSKEEKSSSEIRSEKLAKDAESCKRVKHGSMTCVVCKNLKTGDNYEQCSYSSEPNEKKYAYVKEKKYSSNDDPDADRHQGEGEDAEGSQKDGRVQGTLKHRVQRRGPRPLDKGDFEGTEKVVRKRQGKKRKNGDYEGFEASDEDSIGDYHFRVFPDYSSRESQKQETRVQRPEGTNRRDVEDVLADFAKKNRSDCKRVLKNGMTCFQCRDKGGAQHEECMFVSESRPQGRSNLAYGEVQEYRSEPQTGSEAGRNGNGAADAKKETNRRTRKVLRKSQPELSAAADAAGAPEESASVVQRKPSKSKVPRQYRRKNNISVGTSTQEPEVAESGKVERKRKGKEDEVEPTIETPKEFDVHGAEGAFSSETKPVFSKKLGFSLPKFMLEKSADQLEFEEFEKNG